MTSRNSKSPLVAVMLMILFAVPVASAQVVAGFGGGPPPPPRVSVLSGGRIVAAVTIARDRVWARGLEGGKWEVYRAPAKTRVGVISAADLMATTAEGERITQVAAFSARAGKWRTQDLRDPASGRLDPIISMNVAAYASGRCVYAYSAEADRWDVVEFPEGAPPQVIVGFGAVTAQGGDIVAVFTAKAGTWDAIDVTK